MSTATDAHNIPPLRNPTPLLILLSTMSPFMADDDLRRQKGSQRGSGGGKNTARMMVKTRPPTL